MNDQPGRNDPCWCNSGKKYKKCHLRSDSEKAASGSTIVKQPARMPTVVQGVISPMLKVPKEITRPEYAKNGKPTNKKKSCKKESLDEIDRMRKAGVVARDVLDTVLAQVRPGVTTDELDRIAHERAIQLGGYPSPLNYMGFPKSICTSVNEIIVHGIPDSRVLVDGDIINCDVTVFSHGMHGDCSETVFVGNVSDDAKKLVQVTWECLMKSIELVKPGQPFNTIGKITEEHAHKHGFSVIEEFMGHGIGEFFHMQPNVAHFYQPHNKMVMEEGMTFTIEPMINAGVKGCVIWDDNWTAVTPDLARAAQFEHTLLVTADGVEILTGGTEPFFKKK